METTRANLEQIIQSLQAAGSKVLLAGMTLPPNYGGITSRCFGQIYVDLADEIQDAADSVSAIGRCAPSRSDAAGRHSSHRGRQ